MKKAPKMGAFNLYILSKGGFDENSQIVPVDFIEL